MTAFSRVNHPNELAQLSKDIIDEYLLAKNETDNEIKLNKYRNLYLDLTKTDYNGEDNQLIKKTEEKISDTIIKIELKKIHRNVLRELIEKFTRDELKKYGLPHSYILDTGGYGIRNKKRKKTKGKKSRGEKTKGKQTKGKKRR